MGSTTAFIFALESLLHCVALGLLLHWRSNIPKTRYPLNYIPLFSSVIFTAGAVVMAISNSKEILLVGRLIVGAGIGNVYDSFVHYRVSQQVWNTQSISAPAKTGVALQSRSGWIFGVALRVALRLENWSCAPTSAPGRAPAKKIPQPSHKTWLKCLLLQIS